MVSSRLVGCVVSGWGFVMFVLLDLVSGNFRLVRICWYWSGSGVSVSGWLELLVGILVVSGWCWLVSGFLVVGWWSGLIGWCWWLLLISGNSGVVCICGFVGIGG